MLICLVSLAVDGSNTGHMTLSKCYKVWANRWILNWVVCKQSPANELFKSLKSLNIGLGLPSRALGPDHSLLPSFLLPVQRPREGSLLYLDGPIPSLLTIPTVTRHILLQTCSVTVDSPPFLTIMLKSPHHHLHQIITNAKLHHHIIMRYFRCPTYAKILSFISSW